MTSGALDRQGSREWLERVVQSPITLWVGFVIVHFWLGAVGLYGPGNPLGDLFIYRGWVENGVVAQQWVGLNAPGVYPIVALLPMVIAHAFGSSLYFSTWLSLVMIVDAAAFAVVMAFGRDRRVAHVAWWWLGLQLLLGPVALGRIDAIVAPVALVGLLCLAEAPRLAGALLAIAAWIKVWPAALIAAAVIAVHRRGGLLLGALVTSAVVLAVGLALGGGPQLFSFVTQQADRGLQIESGLGTFWMWDGVLHPGRSTLYYDTSILTFQLRGPGVAVAAALATPLLVVAVAGLLTLAVIAVRRGAATARLLPPLALAITTALILFNKVGSPQFVTWLAVPIVLGLSAAATGRGASFRVPAIVALVIAGLTQLIYPFQYDLLLVFDPVMVLVLSVRNLLYLALLGWAVVALVRLARAPLDARSDELGRWLPPIWPFGSGDPRQSVPTPAEARDPRRA